MSERKKIEDRLKKKVSEVNSLEEKIKSAKIYIQALQDILKLMDGDDEQPKSESTLKVGSAVAQARDFILGRAAPVHINEILEALGKGDTREAKASLTSSLAAYVRRGDIFTRPAPNTFGLIELGHDTIDEESAEPPSNFGGDLDEEIPF